jgi:hypothetical protein
MTEMIPLTTKTNRELLVLVASHCNQLVDDINEMKTDVKRINGSLAKNVQDTADNHRRIEGIEGKLTFNWKTGSFIAVILALVVMEIKNLLHWG